MFQNLRKVKSSYGTKMSPKVKQHFKIACPNVASQSYVCQVIVESKKLDPYLISWKRCWVLLEVFDLNEHFILNEHFKHFRKISTWTNISNISGLHGFRTTYFFPK